MVQEPPLDHTQLKEAVAAQYGVRAVSLTFIPKGFTAAAYRLTCTLGTPYLLKVWPGNFYGSADVAQRRTGLRLARALYDRQLLPHVSYPLTNIRGKLYSKLPGASFALLPLINGAEPDFGATPELWDTFAKVLAALHQATSVLSDVLPPRETFDLSGLNAALNQAFALLEQNRLREHPGVEELRALVLPRREEVFTQLSRLHRLQGKVRRIDGPFVLCHTDAGSENLLVDARGDLHVLDWDEARVAPPEHDLHEARWGNFGHVLRVYREHGGAQPLSLEHFAFYLLRRHLGDMTARCERILNENLTAGQVEEALEGVEAWGFRQWRALDGTLARLARGLDALSKN